MTLADDDDYIQDALDLITSQVIDWCWALGLQPLDDEALIDLGLTIARGIGLL